MAKRTWILADVDQDLFVEEISLRPADVKGPADGYSVTKRRLRGGLRDGVDVIEVDNGLFRFVVIPTRGMGIWRARLGDVQLGWQSPVKGPVHPAMVHSREPGGLGWLDGFDEFIVRCGLQKIGAPEFDESGRLVHGLHGKIANLPAHKVTLEIDGESGEISMTGVVDEARLYSQKLRLTSTVTTKVGQPGLTIRDRVTNIAGEPGAMMLLYHVNVGSPLIEAGAKFVAPVLRMAPEDAGGAANAAGWNTYVGPAAGKPEENFYFELAAAADGWTRVMLHNAAGSRGMGLRFNKKQLPCFNQWKNEQAKAEGYVTGIEPTTNFLNPRAIEEKYGRLIVLAPGESRDAEVGVEVYANAAEVSAAKEAIAKLQQGVTPKFCKELDPHWCGMQ